MHKAAYPPDFSNCKVSLWHDWLTGMRGGEKVLEILADWFGDAVICSLIANRRAVSAALNQHRIETSYLQNIPGIFSLYRYFLPVFPLALKTIQTPASEIIISTSHCVAKGYPKPSGARHMCYCFTPMRYAWLFHNEYLGQNSLKRLMASPVLAYMRKWDKESNANVDMFVAISEHIRTRIRTFYGRNAELVYPPVDTERFQPVNRPSNDFDLIVSALVPYKKIDIAVTAYRNMPRRLVVAGSGTEFQRLKNAAPSNVKFLGWQSDDQILNLYQNCSMLIFPGEEDFGIVPIEAQACGRPVAAYNRGGASESIISGRTGVFFDQQTPEALAQAVKHCANTKWDTDAIRQNALRFSVPVFIEGISECIRKLKNLPVLT